MDYIKAKAGERIFYIEKERIEAIVMKPEIWRVPEAPEDTPGVAVYGHKLVAYRDFGTGREVPCGILIRDGEGGLHGFAAQAVEEEELSAEEAEAAEPCAFSGVWEKSSD